MEETVQMGSIPVESVYYTEPCMINEITVHAGKFHSDDVFCAALARIINPEVKIHRVKQAYKDITDLSAGIVMADIGGGRFDHHQADAPFREDGIRHCAVTRLWLHFGFTAVMTVGKFEQTAMPGGKTEQTAIPDGKTEQTAIPGDGKCCRTEEPDKKKELSSHGFCPDADQIIRICDIIDRKLFRMIAAYDNGDSSVVVDGYAITDAIASFLPTWNSNQNVDEAFMNAAALAKMLLYREIEIAISLVQAEKDVQEALSRKDQGVFVLNCGLPWKDAAVEDEDALICVYPSQRSNYNAQMVPVAPGSFECRILPPADWRAKRDAEAEAYCEGMTFCHANGFLCAFDSLEHAVAGAKKIVELAKK